MLHIYSTISEETTHLLKTYIAMIVVCKSMWHVKLTLLPPDIKYMSSWTGIYYNGTPLWQRYFIQHAW